MSTSPLRAPYGPQIFDRLDAQIDGVKTRYVEIGEGPAMVLLHGFGGRWQVWRDCLPGLAVNHRVIALDLPGCGRSHELPAQADFAAYGERVVELLDHLDIDEAILVGHSLGGFLAQRITVDNPDRVRGLALISSGGTPFERRDRLAVSGVLAASAVLRMDPLRSLLLMLPRVSRKLLTPLVGDPYAVTPALLNEILAGVQTRYGSRVARAGMRDEAWDEIGGIVCPTGVWWGGADRILPVRVGRVLAERIPGAEFHVLQGVGHAPMIERPSVLVAELLDWAAGLPPEQEWQ